MCHPPAGFWFCSLERTSTCLLTRLWTLPDYHPSHPFSITGNPTLVWQLTSTVRPPRRRRRTSSLVLPSTPAQAQHPRLAHQPARRQVLQLPVQARQLVRPRQVVRMTRVDGFASGRAYTFCSGSSTSTANQPLATKYAQCGGSGWTGPTQCVAGSTCTKLNDFVSVWVGKNRASRQRLTRRAVLAVPVKPG